MTFAEHEQFNEDELRAIQKGLGIFNGSDELCKQPHEKHMASKTIEALNNTDKVTKVSVTVRLKLASDKDEITSLDLPNFQHYAEPLPETTDSKAALSDKAAVMCLKWTA